ncbi:MAG TPA: cell division protein SepF [Coriobacteriia bacterium]|nr:cell division protein SepF [Coriobacteriia bacterium]
MGLLHAIKVRLGLADDWDDDYADDDDEGYYDADEARDRPGARHPYGAQARGAAAYESVRAAESGRSVHRVDRDEDEWERRPGHLRAVPAPGGVPSIRPQVKVHISEPKTFTEAQSIADRFKSGMPVIINLSGTKSDVSKRLIDFASGLAYGLDGGLQKVSDKVFMLTPANVDVSAEDRRRLRDKGLFNLE